MASSQTRSVIWDYFNVCENDDSKVKCNVCDKLISRGGKDRSGWGHKGMRKHLATHHPAHQEYTKKQKSREKEKMKQANEKLKLEQAKKLSAASQSNLQESFVKIWDINSSSSQAITRKIAEFICVDNQPLSVVEDEGFLRLLNHLQPKYKCPNRKYFSNNLLPEMYASVKTKIDDILNEEHFISFTCDIWSSRVNESYCSLTAHFVDENFNRKEATLACSYFPGVHGGKEVGEKVKTMLIENNILDKLHVIVRDSGSNMVAGFRDAGIPSVPCLAHILQNAINDGLLKGEEPISRLLSASRRLVGHFKHSTKATDCLKKYQKSLLPVEEHHSLLQSEPTRWNSDFYMLVRLIEQKLPVLAALSELKESKSYLRDDQWELASHVVDVLSPFEEATRKLSSESACISQIIPFVHILKVGLIKSKEDLYLLSAKNAMIKGIDDRTEQLFDNEACILATVLDPRYKLKMFTTEEIRLKAKLTLLSKMAKAPLHSSKPSSVISDSGSPVQKKSRIEQSGNFGDLMNELVQSSDEESTNSDANEKEVNLYLSEKVDQNENPLKFWSIKKTIYPKLAQLARKYLSPPPTSTPSERLFSKSGLICSDRRTRLLPEKLEILVYLSNNLKRVNFEH